MSSLAYLHQTNILYSRISARYNADTEDKESESFNPIQSIQQFLTPATKQLRTLFFPHKGRKRAFIMHQYLLQQARLKSFTRTLLAKMKLLL